MNDLQVINLENTDIGNWDFERIRSELQSNLELYTGIIYDDSSIKEAKNDRSTLNKAKKIIEDARKAYKARCLAPYDALEPKIKELVSMIENQRILIDETVKDYESRQKAEKEQEVKKYYDRKAVILGSLADGLYPKLFDKKWVNAGTSRVKFEEGVQTAINHAFNDLEAIKAIDSPFTEALIQVYTQTLSMDMVKERNAELIEAAAMAGLEKTGEGKGDSLSAPISEKQPAPANAEDGTAMRVHATQYQLTMIFDFMKAIGVDYELL